MTIGHLGQVRDMHHVGVAEIGTRHLVLAIDLEATLQEILHSVLGGREKVATVLLCPNPSESSHAAACLLSPRMRATSHFEPLLGRAAGRPAA